MAKSKGSSLEAKKAALSASRRSQERVENTEEIALAIRQWNGRSLVGGGACMLTGDYCCECEGGLSGSRGAFIPLSASEISELLDDGSMSSVFNPDDLNAPDFHDRMDSVLSKYAMQRSFADAPHYVRNDKSGEAVAAYDGGVSVSVSDGSFKASKDATHEGRECTYEEFNPGGVELRNEARESAKEGRSVDKLFKELQKAYGDGGDNRVSEVGEKDGDDKRPLRPDQARGYDKLSSVEKLSAQRKYTEQNERMQSQGLTDDDISPKLPGQRRSL